MRRCGKPEAAFGAARLGADHIDLEVDDGVDALIRSSPSGDGAGLSTALQSDATKST